MFEISKQEYDSLRTQFASLKNPGRGRHSKYMPFAFSEHGVTMLASVLNSDRAISMNIAIVRAFISLRQMIVQHKGLAEQLQQLRQELYERIGEHDTQLTAIYDAIENLLDNKIEKPKWNERERIGFKKWWCFDNFLWAMEDLFQMLDVPAAETQKANANIKSC